jgi:hypothetical protein
MKTARIALLLVTSLLALTACKSKEEPTPVASSNPLLDYVPGDTPYLMANLEPTPADVIDAYLARFEPSLELVQALLDDMEIEIKSDDSGDMQQAALLAAIINELDGKLNRAGLESLGLSLESHKAFYGMGAFPVARVALRDADALRAAIGRIETDAGMNFPEQTSGDASYYRLSPDDGSIGLYIAILDGQLAMSVFPVALEGEILPNLLAQSMPDDTFDAGAALAEMNRDKGFLGYGSGFLDFRKIAAEFMLPDSRTSRGLRAIGEFNPPGFDADCTAEIGQLIDTSPRMVMGTTELTANAIGLKYQVELEADLATELTELVSEVSPAGSDTSGVLEMSVALQMGRVREFLLQRAMDLAASPFTCPQLQPMNNAANQLLAAMNQPMPPFIGNINGFRLQLQEVDFQQPDPATSRGLLVLEVEKPQMLVGSAQMFIPGLENLALEPGGEPVEVPQELMTVAVDGMHVSAAMSKNALAVSLGKDQSASLMAFLEANEDNGGAFLSVDYDMAAQMQFQDTMQEMALDAQDGQENPEAGHVMEMLREVEESYRDMLGRSRLELRFVPAGFEIHSHVTFN